MAKGFRRQSQNSMLMRSILQHLREYDLEEVKLLCKRYLEKEKNTSRRTRKYTRRLRKNGDKSEEMDNDTTNDIDNDDDVDVEDENGSEEDED